MRSIPAAAFLTALTLTLASSAATAYEVDFSALPSAQATGFERAESAFREHRYAEAYGRLVRLADAGHEPSARLALMMMRHGKSLFGNDWSASIGQQLRWNALVVNGARGDAGLVDNDLGD